MTSHTSAPIAAPTQTDRAVAFGSTTRRTAILAAFLAASAGSVMAQAAPKQSVLSRFEFVVSSGGLLPTGDQRDALKSANMTLAQLSFSVNPLIAMTASTGWARSRDIARSGDPKLDVFTYDVGAELRIPNWMYGRKVTFMPFAGAGAGGRSYNYRSLDANATHNLATYASLGGEAGYRRIRFRVEARDYLSGFKPLVANGASGSRNDVTVMAGFRITAH